MELHRQLLNDAAKAGILTNKQADRLWQFLEDRTQDVPSFRFTHILYYLGGLIAIGAMSLFMTLGWERFGGWGLFGIALGYAVAGLCLTQFFLKRKLNIPAGITATFVVVLTPLAVYGLQTAMGWWSSWYHYREYHVAIDWRWLMMELATLAVGAIMLWRYRLPFLVMPVAVTLWYMSMDIAPFLANVSEVTATWELKKIVSLYFGLLMILLAFWIDLRSRRSKKDYPFWLYLFGVIAFWGGLSLMESDSELNKFIYLCINLALIVIGAILGRRVFAVFGGLGTAGYVGHLAYEVFKNSVLFPFALTAIGLAVVYLGILWQRHERDLNARLRTYLPRPMRQLLEKQD